jgi:hypothetical protein
MVFGRLGGRRSGRRHLVLRWDHTGVSELQWLGAAWFSGQAELEPILKSDSHPIQQIAMVRHIGSKTD